MSTSAPRRNADEGRGPSVEAACLEARDVMAAAVGGASAEAPTASRCRTSTSIVLAFAPSAVEAAGPMPVIGRSVSCLVGDRVSGPNLGPQARGTHHPLLGIAGASA